MKRSDKVVESSLNSIETTIGELIETVTAIALESGKDEEECYALATVVINDMLQRAQGHQIH